jgi:hypothetical protein
MLLCLYERGWHCESNGIVARIRATYELPSALLGHGGETPKYILSLLDLLNYIYHIHIYVCACARAHITPGQCQADLLVVYKCINTDGFQRWSFPLSI